MNNQIELEWYWHWLHGLVGISQKEKEGLLNLCPKVEIWYEFAKRQKTSELFLSKQKKETEKQKERREQVQTILESDAQSQQQQFFQLQPRQ